MVGSKSNGRKYSVMMYSHDGFGLGHARRNYIIARHGIQKIPSANFLMLTGSMVPIFYYLPQGIDLIKLPSIIKVKNGHWSPRTLSIELEDFKHLRANTIRSIAEIFKPDIFIADYTPTGIWQELAPAFDVLKNRKNPARIVLGLRDILDAPQVTTELWRQQGAYEFLKKYYDRILIYGCREVFDTGYNYNLVEDFYDKIDYCGYLSSKDLGSGGIDNQKFEMNGHYRILITAGGGYDAFPMMQLTISALKEVFKVVSAEAVFITGPLMNPESYENLMLHAKNLPIKFIRYDDPLSYINSADLVITMASYNTLVDMVYARKNIIVIPRSGPSAEQKMRAEIFHKLGLVTSLNPAEKVTPSELVEVIFDKLSKPLVPEISIEMDGLNRTISEIKMMADLVEV